MALMGGIKQVQDATAEIQELCDKVRSDVEAKAGSPFTAYVAKSFTSQLVNGTNYFVKVHVGGDNHVHLRIYRPFEGEPNLHCCLFNKTAEDPVVHFDASE